MKKLEVVKSKRDFNDIIQNAPFKKNQSFVIYIRKKEEEKNHFGIAVSNKLGNAVTRNKLTRQVRAILDEEKINFPNHRDYIIMIKKSCVGLSFSKMQNDLENLIKEIKWKQKK